MSLENLSISLKPLETDINEIEADGSFHNPLYSARLLHSLVLRVSHISNAYEVFTVTISPKDTIVKLPCKEIDNMLINYSSYYPLKILFYPEISKKFRYHYHGLVFVIRGEIPSFEIWKKGISRKIGNTYSQRFYVTDKPFKAYNAKTRTEQETTTKQVIDYITKSVNNSVLMNYLNADRKFKNLEDGKGFKELTVSTVITDLNKYDMLNLVQNSVNTGNIEIF